MTDVEESEIKEEHYDIVSKINEHVTGLKEIDDYFNELPQLQQKVNFILSDLSHFLQKIHKDNIKLTGPQSKRFVELFLEKRIERHKLNNVYEIKQVYNAHRQKLAHETQRDFLMSELYKKEKLLDTDYNWRVLTEEDIWKEIK